MTLPHNRGKKSETTDGPWHAATWMRTRVLTWTQCRYTWTSDGYRHVCGRVHQTDWRSSDGSPVTRFLHDQRPQGDAQCHVVCRQTTGYVTSALALMGAALLQNVVWMKLENFKNSDTQNCLRGQIQEPSLQTRVQLCSTTTTRNLLQVVHVYSTTVSRTLNGGEKHGAQCERR